MPANLKLLPSKEFEITLSNGTLIKGKFGTWSIKRFCDRRKISFQELSKLGDFDLDHLVDMILSAVEYAARKEKTAFSFTDIDACEWIDELGGPGSTEVSTLFKHMNSEENLAMPEGSGEKKTESLPGLISSEAISAPEVQ